MAKTRQEESNDGSDAPKKDLKKNLKAKNREIHAAMIIRALNQMDSESKVSSRLFSPFFCCCFYSKKTEDIPAISEDDNFF